METEIKIENEETLNVNDEFKVQIKCNGGRILIELKDINDKFIQSIEHTKSKV